jgi:ketosteroid isomerase-like protein
MGGNRATLEAIHEVLIGPDGLIPAESAEQVLEVLREIAEPDFICRMVGPDVSFVAEQSGPEGFIAAWGEWTSPFEEYRIEVERTIDAGDNLVDFVRQTAVTTRGGVPVETRGAGVWTFRDGRLAKAEFHLDRERALEAAGLDPAIARERAQPDPGSSRNA